MTADREMDGTIVSIQVGKAVPFGPERQLSAIDKHSVEGPVSVGSTGLAGDEQGDPRHHGGVEMAVHQYPLEHYDAWKTEVPALEEKLESPGAFGENLSTRGMTETSVCIGDIYQVGSAVFQVSQGRQPCWKLNVRFGVGDMAKRVQTTARTGWYYRVLSPGAVTAGDGFSLVERPRPEWSVSKVLHVLYVDRLNLGLLKEMAALEELSPSWRQLARNRLEKEEVEGFGGRLSPPH